jgi:hypothetical protein
MKKEFVGFRTDFKDDYRRVRDVLGLSTLTEAHEALLRAVTQPWLPLSEKTLEAFAVNNCCFACSAAKCGATSAHCICSSKKDAEERNMCSDCSRCRKWTPKSKGTDQK